jgi:chromosome segregation ATPase
MEKIREELHSSQKEVATAKAEVTKSQVHVGALETKVSELQASFTKERAQTQAHTLRIEEDKKIIQDLNRQVHIHNLCLSLIFLDLMSVIIQNADFEAH